MTFKKENTNKKQIYIKDNIQNLDINDIVEF